MKKEDINHMLSMVDEKYIDEITESGFDDFHSENEVSGEVQVVKHISHWRTWAAAAAALIVCVGLGGVLMRQTVIHQNDFSVGQKASVDFVDSLSDEELDNYFLNDIENLPDFPHTQIDSRTEHIIPPIGKNQADTGNIGFSQTHDYAEFSMLNPGTCVVIMRVFDTAPDLDFSQAEAYHIDDYDVDFYGVYGQTVSEPMPYSQSFFTYHGRMYNLYTDTLDKKEVIRLVYEILDSDFSAKSLYLEYATTEEDFVSYFTELPSDVSDLDYYHETALFDQYGHDYGEVDNITPPIAGNWFDKANQLFLNENSVSRTAKFSMDRSDGSLNLAIMLDIYDNPQIDMNEFTSLTPYHIDDYNMDFYGIYKTFDGDPIRNITKGIFLYHDRLYILHTTNFSRKETMQIVYEILDSEPSANDLYEQYRLDIQSDEELQAYFKGLPEEGIDIPQEIEPVENWHLENVSSFPIQKDWCWNVDMFFTSADGNAPATHVQIDFRDATSIPACVQIFDSVTELPESFATVEPYHLDDYDVDIYGRYETENNLTPRHSSRIYFEYHGRFYFISTIQLSRKETLKLVYDVLDNDFSASGLYEQYTGDIISWEDERTTEETVPESVLDLKTANKLAFCYGLVPEFFTLNGENQREIDGGNMTMDGEYSYENTYDDSDLLWNADSIRYDENAGDGTGHELFYKYTNEDCELDVYYFTYTDELRENSAVPWTEDTSLKTLLKEPYCTNAEGQDDNSRLKDFDFVVDLGNHTAVQLTGTCTVNHIDYFILQLRVMTASFDAVPDKEALFAEMNAQPYCMGIIPEVQDIDILHLKTANIYSDEPNGPSTQVDLKYEYHERQEYVIPDEHPYMTISFFDETENEGLLSVDELTEEKLEEMGVFSEDVCWFAVKHPYGNVSICAGYCTKEQIMTYVNLLKERIESVTE